MSVDNRVVKLQFDNKQFEQGVSQSMSTIDKLEQKLQFKNSAKGFSTLQSAAEAVHFDKLLDGIDAINKKLSAGGIIAAKFVSNIAESVANGVKKVEQASIGQIKSGGWARAMKIENAKFAVQGLKGDWDELYKAIDYSVSGTAYGVDAAAKAASTLMASGVDYMKVVDTKNGQQLTQMHKSLRAISGVAAQTNSEFDDIAHIFTTVAGNNKLMGEQLQQLSGRGMNAAAILAEQLHMTETDLREAVHDGQIDFQTFANAMDSAFGEHAKDANKTFTGSLSNMKAALSRFGAVFATPIIQKTNTFFIALTGQINKMKKAIADTTENGKVLEQHLEGHFAKMWENLITLGSTLVNSIDLTWFEKVADSVDGFVERLSDAFEIMNAFASTFSTTTDKTAKKVYDTTTITEGELDAVERIIKGVFGNGAKRKKEIEKYLKENDLNYDPDKLQAYVNVLSKVNYIFEKAGIKKVKEAGAESEKYNKKQESVQKTFINVYSAIHNFNAALSKLKDNLSDYFKRITEPFGGVIGIAEQVTGVISDLVLAFDTLVDAIKPTSDVLYGFYDIGRALSEAFEWIVNGIKTAIQWLSTFIASVIVGWKQSGVLTNTLVNIAKTIRNLTRILTNLATSASRIFKAIATAFFRVFNPEKASDMLSRFTGGLADISDKFLLSEEAADVLTEVLTGLFTVIDGILSKIGEVIIKITEFVGGFKKVNDTVAETTDETDEISDSVDETTGKFDKLIEIGTKVKDFFKDLGKNFTELIDELKKNEGIQHLKDSLKELGDAFKDSVQDRIDDFKEGLEEVNEEAGTKFTVKDLADGIGAFADKIAHFVDEIPGAITKIEEFFTKAYDKISAFVQKINASESWKSFKGFFDNLFNFGSDVMKDAKGTFEGIGDSILSGLEGINWKDVLNSSFVLGALAFVIQMSRLADAIRNVFVGVDGIIKAVGLIAKNAAMFIGQIGSGFERISKALIITSIATLILSIASSMYIISNIDTDRLYDALGVIVVVGLIFTGLMKAIAKMEWGKAAKQLQQNQVSVVEKIATTVIKILAVAAVMYILAKAVSTLIDTIKEVAKILDTYDADQLIGSLIGIAFIFGVLFVIASLLIAESKILTRNMEKGVVEAAECALMLIGMGVVFALIGAAIYLIAESIPKLAEVGDNLSGAIWAVVGIMVVLTIAVVAMSKAISKVGGSELAALAVILLELIVALGVVFAGIYLLAALISANRLIKKDNSLVDPITEAALMVSIVMLALGGTVLMVTNSIKEVSTSARKTKASGKLMTKIMLGIIGLVTIALGAVVALAVVIQKMDKNQLGGFIGAMVLIDAMILALAEMIDKFSNIFKVLGTADKFGEASKLMLSIGAMMLMILGGMTALIWAVGEYDLQPEELIIAMAGMAIIIVIIGIMFKMILDQASKINPSTGEIMKNLSESILMLGATVLIIGLAVALIARSLNGINKEAIIGTGVIIGVIMVALLLIVSTIMNHLFSLKNGVDPSVAGIISSLGLMFVELGASMLLIAAALYIIAQIPLEDILKAGITLTVMIVIIGLLAMLVGKSDSAGKGIGIIAIGLLAIGAAFVVFGAGLLLCAAGLVAMAPALTAFIDVFKAFAEVLEKHHVVALAIGIAVIAMTLIIGIVLIKLLSVLDKVVQGVVNALNTILEIIKKVGGSIKDKVSSFHKNKEISKGVKATIVTMLVALASSLVDAGPEALQKIGDFLWLVIDWLIEVTPKLCDKIVDIFLALLWGILDAITNHINEIEAAIFAIIETIFAIVVKLLVDAIAELLDIFSGLPLVGKLVDGVTSSLRELGDASVQAAKEHAKALKESAKARDAAIRDGTVEKLYEEQESWLKGNRIIDKTLDDQLASQNKLLQEDKENRDKIFKDFASGVDMKKNFIVARKDTKTALEEQKSLIDQNRAFIDANGDFYRLSAESNENLKLDPHYLDQFKYYYRETADTAKEASKATDAIDGLKDKGKDLLQDFGLPEDNLSTLVPTELSPDSISLDSFGLDTNQLPTDASNLGTLVGGNAGQSTEDALAAFGVNINDTTSLMGEDGAASFSTAFDSGLVGDAGENERAADMVADTTAANLSDKENQDKVKEAGRILSSAGAKGVSGKNYLWIQAGGDIIEGLLYHPLSFINGTANETNSGAWLADHLVHSIYDPFVGPRGFNIGSPSKVMEKIGNYIIQGLANGINSETEDATNAMSNVSDMMMNSFANPLNYVMQMLNGELQYDPSIRPVLDTSNIASGAYGINSMFDNQNVTLSGLSGTIAADIGRLDNSNADIIKELRLLRNDVTDMGKEISNMQVVMDSGRLVGAIASDMDSALGGRSSYSYRGKGN